MRKLLALIFTTLLLPSVAFGASLSSYGVKCDGITDDAPKIRKALEDAGTKWSTLEFPAGKTCIIGAGVDIVGRMHFTINGNGATLKAKSGMAVVSNQQLFHITRSHHFKINNLTIDGNRTNRKPAETTAHSIHITESTFGTFTRVRSINAVTDGFYINATNNADANTFPTDLTFIDCEALNGYRQGMSIINGKRITVRGGSYSGTNGTWPQAGIDMEPNPGSAVPGIDNVLVTGVRFIGNNGRGIDITHDGLPSNITVEKSYFENNGRGGIRFSGANVTFRDNYFLNHNRSTVACPASQCHRAVIEAPSAAVVGPYWAVRNTVKGSSSGNAALYNHGAAIGLTMADNCLQSIAPKPIQNGGGAGTYINNPVNPNGGCSVSAGVPMP